MDRLDGKVAIVSGAGSGMGEEHARALVQAGARVIGFDITPGSGPALADELGPDRFRWLLGDVTSVAGWQCVVAECVAAFGHPTVLVNNAGIARANRVETVEESEYRRVIDVNQVGPFLGMQSVVGSMKAAGGGSIVNICSTSGLVGFTDNFAYVASKWAVRGMTKAAALELAEHRIRVNAVFPGETDTPLLRADPTALPPESSRFGRWARPSEISAAVVFLASEEAGYMSGAELVIDGTYTAA
ncbi:SDR family NAD(P)-dependent oxidoreductase [Streptomyces asiaticus]